MKELIYQHKLGNNPSKKEISLVETTDSRKVRIVKMWISKCFVREKFSSFVRKELESWIMMKRANSCANHFHIYRRMDTKTGENIIMCKSLTDIFTVVGITAYHVAYVREIKIQIEETT